MEIIRINWGKYIKFNKVQVIGKAPLPNKFVGKFIETAMISQALNFIEEVENLPECTILSEEPEDEDMELKDKNAIIVSFSVIFKDPRKAVEYYLSRL